MGQECQVGQGNVHSVCELRGKCAVSELEFIKQTLTTPWLLSYKLPQLQTSSLYTQFFFSLKEKLL